MYQLKSSLLSLALLALTAPQAWANPQQPEPAPLRVGAILTLSGNFAAAGDDSRRGIEAALAAKGNSGHLQFVYADSRNEPSAAVSEFQKLLNVDQVAAIYTHRSSVGMALNPISLKDGVPLLGAVGHQDFAANNRFAIQAWPRAHDEGSFVADEFARRHFKRVGVLYTEDEWTSSVTKGFRSKLASLGIMLTYDQPVLPGEQDFRTQLLKLKATAPDAIYFNFLLPQIAPAIKQAREMGVSGNFFSNFYLAKKEVRDVAGIEALEGVRYVELENDLPNLKKILGKDEPPPGLAVASYVSTLLLLQAANDDSRPSNTTELMTALSRQKEVRTSDGTYRVEDRCIKFPLVVKVMKNGKFVSEKIEG